MYTVLLTFQILKLEFCIAPLQTSMDIVAKERILHWVTLKILKNKLGTFLDRSGAIVTFCQNVRK